MHKRGPLSTLIYAQRNYAGKITFAPPVFVAPNHCNWCNSETSGDDQFCCYECRKDYINAVYKNGRTGYANHILRRDKYTCQHCHTFHGRINEYGVKVAATDGYLDIHHIVYVCNGGTDAPDNLITLCRACHKNIHKYDRKAEPAILKQGVSSYV